MKMFLVFFFMLSFFAFASEKYGVYDVQGNRISTFEAEPHELSEKAWQVKSDNPHKKLYVSSMQKGKNSRPSFSYRFKTGSYIEAARNETFSLCPPNKKIEGTWISEHSVSLNAENCVSIQTPDLTETFNILFLENSGYTDTIQVLVDQSYIQMGDYSHKVYVLDTNKMDPRTIYYVAPGYYESRAYSQPLIVDKTMFTTGDAWHYSEIDSSINPFTSLRLKQVYENVKLEKSKLPLVEAQNSAWRFANKRSKKEGLDTAYIWLHPHSKEAKKLILSRGDPNINYSSCKSCTILALDTSASGYRVPFNDEWFFLMRAGASTRYYWGNEDMPLKKGDSLIISRYEWVRPSGLKSVAQRLPNAFGLYDMAGIACEVLDLSPESFLMCDYMFGLVGTVNYKGFRLLRKTPKLHKLDKF
jgi:hypothetical protein